MVLLVVWILSIILSIKLITDWLIDTSGQVIPKFNNTMLLNQTNDDNDDDGDKWYIIAITLGRPNLIYVFKAVVKGEE